MKILVGNTCDPYFVQHLDKNFTIIKISFDQVHEYSNQTHVAVIDVSDAKIIAQLRAQGFRLIITKFYDEILDDARGVYQEDGCLYLYARNWCRMHSATVWTNAQHNWLRAPSVPDKFFLMMMNLQREHRTRLFNITRPYHSHSLYSYVEQGYYLPDDAPLSTFKRGTSDQHRYNPTWYEQTAFSMVSEARVKWPEKSATARFVTEKTFKPIAFQHAFLVYGTAGTLDYLHEQGFETFGHVIDQSYDTIIDHTERLVAINTVLKSLYHEYQHGQQLFSDSLSREKILHNFYNFFDADKLQHLWKTEIINPIQEFLNA